MEYFESPVVIMSCDRPGLLSLVLLSLKRQTDFQLRDDKVYLFQDQRDSDTGIAIANRCVESFRLFFPAGRVFRTEKNLGVAGNFRRAETQIFDIDNSESVLFLEDDFVLGPTYLAAISCLRRATNNINRVGVLTAHGTDPMQGTSPLDAASPDSVEKMGQHNWAFLLFRECYSARSCLLSEYYEILGQRSYKDRDEVSDQIFRWLNGLGRTGKRYLTSQDSIKNALTDIMGFYRLSTRRSYGYYLGTDGEHMNKEKFLRAGLNKWTCTVSAPTISSVTESYVSKIYKTSLYS